MIRAKLNNGTFILGVDKENIKRLTEGKPIVVDLSETGGTDTFMMVYGETYTDIMRDLEEANGAPLPTPQVKVTK